MIAEGVSIPLHYNVFWRGVFEVISAGLSIPFHIFVGVITIKIIFKVYNRYQNMPTGTPNRNEYYKSTLEKIDKSGWKYRLFFRVKKYPVFSSLFLLLVIVNLIILRYIWRYPGNFNYSQYIYDTMYNFYGSGKLSTKAWALYESMWFQLREFLIKVLQYEEIILIVSLVIKKLKRSKNDY